MNHQNYFQLVLCPTRAPDDNYLDQYKKIYSCWRKVWKSAYEEINYGDKDHFHSDNFTRQDFAAAVFYKDECAGLLLFRYLDLNLESSFEDSYFDQWSEIHRKALNKKGHKILVCSYLSVDPQYRNNALGISLKEIIVALIAEITIACKVDTTISTPRKNRNMHSTAYKCGATSIASDIEWGFGIQVDLVAFYKENLVFNLNSDIQKLAKQLWQNKLIIQQKTTGSYHDFEKLEINENLNQFQKMSA